MNPRLEPLPPDQHQHQQLQHQHQQHQQLQQPDLRRKVSRVESLRRLLLGRTQPHDSRRLFDRRRYRLGGRSAVTKADKAIGTDMDLMGSEDDLFDRSSSRFNESCDSFDLDSVSQVSLADIHAADAKSSFSATKSISIDNIPHEVSTYHHRTGFMGAFAGSKLAALPEEQATLTRSCREKRRLNHPADLLEALAGPQSLTAADLSPANSAAPGSLTRRRSQSLADIKAPPPSISQRRPEGEESRRPPTINFVTSKSGRLVAKSVGKTKSEESGYDSDTTRKSGSSPRGSVKSDSFDPSETDSSTCDSHHLQQPARLPAAAAADSSATSTQTTAAAKPKIKKPPRKSKEEGRKMETSSSCQTEISPQQLKPDNQHQPALPPDLQHQPTLPLRPDLRHQPSLPFNNNNISSLKNNNVKAAQAAIAASPGPPPGDAGDPLAPPASTLPSLTSKSFKMLRVAKRREEELGIIISKKRDPGNGTTGYVIAHVEPDGLVNK